MSLVLKEVLPEQMMLIFSALQVVTQTSQSFLEQNTCWLQWEFCLKYQILDVYAVSLCPANYRGHMPKNFLSDLYIEICQIWWIKENMLSLVGGWFIFRPLFGEYHLGTTSPCPRWEKVHLYEHCHLCLLLVSEDCYKNVNTMIPCKETRKESFRTSLYLIYLYVYQSVCLGTHSQIFKNSFIWLSFGQTSSLRVGSRWVVTGLDEFWMPRKEKISQPVWVAVMIKFFSTLEIDISFAAACAHCLLCFHQVPPRSVCPHLLSALPLCS